MARYKVTFARRWILGRWGFTDRVLDRLGAKPWEPSRVQSAWSVPWQGTSLSLGRYLTEALRLPHSKDARLGEVFEIEELDPAPPAAPRPARGSVTRPREPRVRQLPAGRG